jgi:hypothetical protein
VNKLKSYEQLIAEKIQQVPVPDMANNIWAHIEQALDGGPGNTGEEQTPAPKSPGGGAYPGSGLYFYIAGCLLIGIIIFVIMISQRSPKPSARPVDTQQKRSDQPGPSTKKYPDTVAGKDETITIPNKPVIKKDDPAKAVLLPIISSNTDSAFRIPVLIPGIDSMHLPNQQLTVRPGPDSLIRQNGIITIKKPKGVTGISDSDYKIKGFKKDSL